MNAVGRLILKNLESSHDLSGNMLVTIRQHGISRDLCQYDHEDAYLM